MTQFREELLDRMVAIYGFEHRLVVVFAEECEKPTTPDYLLEVVVKVHEANPVYEEDE